MVRETSDFKRAYKDLNLAQKEAVDNIFGPVLVVAGPGTGKTQLLATRVGQILLKTDTDPSSVLCLTFTNKAAVNMRDRLISLIGPAARNVYTRTFHSFAAEIMNLYPDYFWNGANLRIAPEALQLEIISEILAKLPLNNPLALKFAGQYTMINDLIQALKLAKEAGLTPNKLQALIDANLKYIDSIENYLVDVLSPQLNAKRLPVLAKAIDKLPEQKIDKLTTPLISLSTVIKESFNYALALDEGSAKTKNVSAWKSRWLQTVSGKKGLFRERKKNQWWHAVADVYKLYRRQMHQRGYYDYGDMLVEVISALEQHPEMLAEVQERFLYVLIDEFQDTNAAQMRLAHLTANHPSAGGKPNLMAVGDDDQAIYKFNGAELNNMLSFKRNYPAAKIITLNESFRSSQPILDTAANVINQANDRLVDRLPQIKKALRSKKAYSKGLIEHQIYPTREHQFSAVADQIKKSQKRGKGSVAVLARNHDGLRQLAAILDYRGIPVRYEQQRNILENDGVVQADIIAQIVVAIAKGDRETVDYNLSQSLPHPMWGLDKTQLWHLALANRKSVSWLDSLVSHKSKKFRAIGDWLLWLSSQSSHQPLPMVIEYILGLRAGPSFTSPLKNYFIAKKSDDFLYAISAIQLLRALSAEFGAAAQTTLEDFVRLIKVSRDNNRVITDESPFVNKPGVVWLYTVHKAKGLEFDQVFIVDAVEENWQPRAGRRKPPANLPLQPHGDEADDYARLMFVAASRARTSLIMTSYTQDHAGNQVLASPFVRAAFKEKVITSAPSKHAVKIIEENLRWPRLSSYDEKETLKARLEEYSLSVTGLLNFLDVQSGGPQYFLERNILQLPEVKTASLAFGTAVHWALDQAQRLTNQKAFKLKSVLTEFEKALKREYLSPNEFNRYLLHGQAILTKLFKDLAYKLPPGSLSEQKVTEVRVGAATLGGKLDRIDEIGEREIKIIDYKTGRPISSLLTNNQSLAIKAWKQRTQLIFYALLAKNSPRFKKASKVTGEMVYVEAGTRAQLSLSYEPSTEEIDRLGELINKVWPKIINMNLPNTTNYTQDYAGVRQFEEDLLNGKI